MQVSFLTKLSRPFAYSPLPHAHKINISTSKSKFITYSTKNHDEYDNNCLYDDITSYFGKNITMKISEKYTELFIEIKKEKGELDILTCETIYKFLYRWNRLDYFLTQIDKYIDKNETYWIIPIRVNRVLIDPSNGI